MALLAAGLPCQTPGDVVKNCDNKDLDNNYVQNELTAVLINTRLADTKLPHPPRLDAPTQARRST